MITVMFTEENKLITLKKDEIKKGCWIDIQSPNDLELEEIARVTGIKLDMLKVPLDEEERAHIDREDGATLIVIDTPIIEDDDAGELQYSTMPLGIIYNENYFITISLRECSVVTDFYEGRVKGFYTFKRVRNTLLLLQRNSTKFLQHLKHIDKLNIRLQTELQRSMKNKEILQLMALEKSLVYFATGINANEFVLEKVQQFEGIKTYKDDMELLEDVILENKQAMEMCSIYADILSGTMDAYASIVSNNLNIVMKKFTVITIIMAIPTLIFSLWGINTPVPFDDVKAGFWIVLGVSALLSVAGAFMISRVGQTKQTKAKRKKSDKRDDHDKYEKRK